MADMRYSNAGMGVLLVLTGVASPNANPHDLLNTRPGPMMAEPHACTAVACDDGRVLVVGGERSGVIESLRADAAAWITIATLPRHVAFSGAAIRGERLVVAGGVDLGDARHAETSRVSVLHLEDHVWSEGPALRRARGRFPLVCAGGDLFALGGFPGNDPVRGDLASVERWARGAAGWEESVPMTSARHGHAAVVVDGEIIVLGGFALRTPPEGGEKSIGTLSLVERYSPATGAWSSLAPLPTPRGFLAAAHLDGKIVTVGGHYEWTTVEVLDLQTGKWSAESPSPHRITRAGAAVRGEEIFMIGGEFEERAVTIFRTALPKPPDL